MPCSNFLNEDANLELLLSLWWKKKKKDQQSNEILVFTSLRRKTWLNKITQFNIFSKEIYVCKMLSSWERHEWYIVQKLANYKWVMSIYIKYWNTIRNILNVNGRRQLVNLRLKFDKFKQTEQHGQRIAIFKIRKNSRTSRAIYTHLVHMENWWMQRKYYSKSYILKSLVRNEWELYINKNINTKQGSN